MVQILDNPYQDRVCQYHFSKECQSDDSDECNDKSFHFSHPEIDQKQKQKCIQYCNANTPQQWNVKQ